MLVTPSGISRAATSRSDYSRGQSRETGCLIRLFGSVDTTSKCVSVGPSYCREATESSLVLLRLDSTGWFPFWWTLTGPGNGTSSRYSVKEVGHRSGSSSQKWESRFYSRYSIVPKKDAGLRPILDLRQLNHSVSRLKFKMLTLKQVVSQIRSEDWFVTINLEDRHTSMSPSLPLTENSWGLLLGAKLTNIRFFPSAYSLQPAAVAHLLCI